MIDALVVVFLLMVLFLGSRAIYRALSFSRSERAFLSVASSRGLDRGRAIDFINLARAKGTTAMQELTLGAKAIDQKEILLLRQKASIAVMERAARDEHKRLTKECSHMSQYEISSAADAAGVAMLNQYVETDGPLSDDSPLGPDALQALINECNGDLRGVPEGTEYQTQIGRVAKASMTRHR